MGYEPKEKLEIEVKHINVRLITRKICELLVFFVYLSSNKMMIDNVYTRK